MKRILLSFLTILFLSAFSTIANAQTALPSEPTDSKFKGAKHMWVCADQIQPVSLEWDVANKGLSLANGKWTGVYPNTIPGYSGSNVFNVLEVATGTYIFQYTVDSGKDFCGLAASEYVWVYVHVLPNMADIASTPIGVCNNATTIPGFKTNPLDYISAITLKAIQDAGYTVTATPAAIAVNDFLTPPSTSVGVKTKSVAIAITPNTPNNFGAPTYACGATFNLVVKVIVADLINITGNNPASRCITDIDPTDVNGDFYVLFGATAVGQAGTWTVPSGQPTAPTTGVGMTIDYSQINMAGSPYVWTFTYNDCDGASKTVTYTLTLTNTNNVTLPAKSSTICKDDPINPSNISLTALYDGSTKNYTWEYLGIDGAGTQGPTNPVISGGHFIPKNSLADNFTYHFRVSENFSSGSCTAGSSAIFQLKAESLNASAAGDERIAICKGMNAELDFAALFGKSNATWGFIAPTPNIISSTTGKIAATDVKDLIASTYQFTYNSGVSSAANPCASSGNGIVYLTVRNTPLVSDNITITFCTQTMDKVNLYNLLGVYTEGTWSSSATFDASTGDVDLIALYTAAPATNSYVFTFTPDAGTSCLTGNKTVTIIFTDTI